MEKIRALKRSFDLLSLYEQEYNDQETVLGGKSAGDWYTYSAEEFVKNCNLVSLGFLSLGVKKGDVVATITNNRPEWNFVDMGLAQIGAVHLPIYPTIGTDEYKYIFEHSKAKFVLVGDKKIYGKIHDFGETVESIEEIFSFDEVEGIRNWIDISKLGDEYNRKSELQSLKEEIQEDDLATLIYTSGTTGDPKGVMLSHRNLVSNFTQHCYNHTLEILSASGRHYSPPCHDICPNVVDSQSYRYPRCSGKQAIASQGKVLRVFTALNIVGNALHIVEPVKDIAGTTYPHQLSSFQHPSIASDIEAAFTRYRIGMT